MPEINIIDDVTMTDEAGIPTFTFISQRSEELAELFNIFPLRIMPIDVPFFRTMPLPPDLILPPDSSLRIEFSLDDMRPHELLWDIYINAEQRRLLTKANRQSRSICVRVQDKQSKQFTISKTENPYIFDWSGTTGIIVYVRTLHAQNPKGWDKKNAYDVLSGTQETVVRDGGYITGLHSVMGLIYRSFNDFDNAIECYLKEIKGATRPDGSFAQSAMLGFCNLAVVYKKQMQIDKARDAFHVALSMNPNYFEANVSIAGCIEDPNISIKHMARAFRVRPYDAIWNQLISILSQGYGIPPQALFNRVQVEAEKVDLSQKVAFDLDAFMRLKLPL